MYLKTISHFGIKLKDKEGGHLLTRDNYCRINKKSSLVKDKIYDDDFCKIHYKRCMNNFDLNMKFFFSLNPDEFENELNNFLTQNPKFIKISSLDSYNKVSGCYLMVLNKYKQIYLGASTDIKTRIRKHWQTNKQFDRLIFGRIENSKISIDSFRALDTELIYIMEADNPFSLEDILLSQINDKFISNRISGGLYDHEILALSSKINRNFSEIEKN